MAAARGEQQLLCHGTRVCQQNIRILGGNDVIILAVDNKSGLADVPYFAKVGKTVCLRNAKGFSCYP